MGTRQLSLIPPPRPTFIGSSREPSMDNTNEPGFVSPPVDGGQRRPLLPTPPNGSMRPPSYVESDAATPSSVDSGDNKQQPPMVNADDAHRKQSSSPSSALDITPATTVIEVQHRPSDSQNEISTNRTTKNRHRVEANSSRSSRVAGGFMALMASGFFLINRVSWHHRVF